MGLRIQTNLTAINALRNLQNNDSLQSRSLERLSTGLRINRGSDDPSGLIISEQFESQITGLKQAVENAENANSLLSTADFLSGQIKDILLQIKSSVVFASNTGGVSDDQIQAEQETVDQAIAAIDRIVSTQYGSRFLLNGASQFQTASSISSNLNNLKVNAVEFSDGASTRTFEIGISTVGQRASATFSSAVTTSGTTTTIRITGARGTQDITLGALSSNSTIATAVNSVADLTGIFASAGGGSTISFRSEDFGTDQTLRIETISGGLRLASAAGFTYDQGPSGANFQLDPSEVILDKGVNAAVTLDGRIFTGDGLEFNINTKAVSLSFNLEPTTTYTTSTNFQVEIFNGLGLNLQVGDGGSETQLAVSLENLSSSALGREAEADFITRVKGAANPTGSSANKFGFLSSLKTGESNDLTTDAVNAANIVDAAILQVSKFRGRIGGLISNGVVPQIEATEVQIENLSAARSQITDLNFAEETTNFTKSQILFQSGIAVLASANLVPQSVLALLR